MISYSYTQKPFFLSNNFKKIFKNVVNKLCSDYNFRLKRIHYHFCDDEYLLKMNYEVLNHDYYTDIITFDYTTENKLEAEMFISLDRVTENSVIYNQTFLDELVRVMIHGLLHCIGFGDSTDVEKNEIRKLEDNYLNFFNLYNVPRGTLYL